MTIFTGLDLGFGTASWNLMSARFPSLGVVWKWLCISSPPVTLMIHYLVSRFAAFRIERSWQDAIPSARRESLLRRFCTPLFRRRFRRRMQKSLDWNPVAWLQQYSWKSRLTKWFLLLLFLLVEGLVTERSPDFFFDGVQVVLLLIAACSLRLAGVSRFLEEKRSGALELLLVTPVSASKIILGRAWGLWRQFLPGKA